MVCCNYDSGELIPPAVPGGGQQSLGDCVQYQLFSFATSPVWLLWFTPPYLSYFPLGEAALGPTLLHRETGSTALSSGAVPSLNQPGEGSTRTAPDTHRQILPAQAGAGS